MATSGNRYCLHFTGETESTDRLCSRHRVTYLLNGRAGTYTQIAVFFPLISSVEVRIVFIFSFPLNQGEYLTHMYMFV